MKDLINRISFRDSSLRYRCGIGTSSEGQDFFVYKNQLAFKRKEFTSSTPATNTPNHLALSHTSLLINVLTSREENLGYETKPSKFLANEK